MNVKSAIIICSVFATIFIFVREWANEESEKNSISVRKKISLKSLIRFLDLFIIASYASLSIKYLKLLE